MPTPDTSALGKLQPIVGVSFGLPNNNVNGYGGYQQNPLNTGTATNPYQSGGISVGAVDINPLVSFQATTNDDGELVNKPLINLHVTPNGCGLFGCENDDPYAPSLADTIFGTRRNQQPNNQYNYNNQGFHPPKHYETLTPSPQYPQPEHYYSHQQNQGSQYQNNYNYQQPQRPRPPRQNPRPSHNNRVRFSSPAVYDQPQPHQQEIKVQHEHHHFHHHKHNSNPVHQGIRFGLNSNANDPAYYEGPYFRHLNDSTDQPIENNQVKRNIFGEPTKDSNDEIVEDKKPDQEDKEESAFRFPTRSGKSIQKRSAAPPPPSSRQRNPTGTQNDRELLFQAYNQNHQLISIDL